MYLNRFCYLLLILAALGSSFSLHPYSVWFTSVSVLTLLIYGMDKRAAQKDKRRIPEATLLLFGVVGGWPGALCGQQLFRHKTQKQPFQTWLYLSILLNVVVLVVVYRWYALGYVL